MDKKLRLKLISIAKEKITSDDSSHDINHAIRVLFVSEKIAKVERADLDIVIPAALFHDIICYPKNHHKRTMSSDESAKCAKKILQKIYDFPGSKIVKVCQAISLCSFTKALKPDFLEAQILQDADGLEATGAVSIMRTFSSAGIMKKAFYNSLDPFCKKRKPDDENYAIDLFFTRLLIVEKKLHTKTAKEMVKKRSFFLKLFLKELEYELKGVL